jgi:hypothetical protein
MGLSAIKRETRLAIHNEMGEPCTYTDESGTVPTVEHVAAGLKLTARFHTKAKVNLGNSDGLTVMEPIEKLIFNLTQVEALGITLENGAHVEFPGYGLTVILDQELDPDGPENSYWTVTRV